jgi:hypothetical protein
MSIEVKNEELFRTLAENCYKADGILAISPTEGGRKQFFEKQSKGIEPDVPDSYYTFLMKGKWSFDFLSSEYKKMWVKREWWGWLTLWLDWKG